MATPSGFIRPYRETYIGGDGTPITNAPDTYHELTAVALLGAAVMDRTRIPYAGRHIGPGLFVVLVGNPTQHPHHAVQLGEYVYRAYQNVDGDTKIGPDDFSVEALLDILADSPSLLLIHADLVHLVALLHQWQGRPRAVIATLASERDYFQVARAGKDPRTIQRPRIAILGGIGPTSLSQIRSLLPDLADGLWSRFLLVAPGDSDGHHIGLGMTPTPLPDPAPPNPDHVEMLAKRLSEIRLAVTHPFEGFNAQANEAINAWYHGYYGHALATGDVQEHAEGIYARLPATLRRLAMIYQIDEDPEARRVGRSATERAIKTAAIVATSANRVSEGLRPTEGAQRQDRVLRAIERITAAQRNGGGEAERWISHRDLARRLHLDRREMETAIDALVAQGYVEVHARRANATSYRLTTADAKHREDTTERITTIAAAGPKNGGTSKRKRTPAPPAPADDDDWVDPTRAEWYEAEQSEAE